MKKTNRILALALALLLALSVFPVAAFANTAEEKPEDAVTNGGNAIYDAADFMAMQEVGGNYYLANDIDLSGVEPIVNQTDTASAGVYYKAQFVGVLNGNGHTIKGVDLTKELTSEFTQHLYIGLFGRVGALLSDTTARHTTVINDLTIGSETEKAVVNLTGDGTFTKQVQVGALSGGMPNDRGWGVTIKNVRVYADIDVTFAKDADSYVGGLIGRIRGAELSDCYFAGSIDLSRGNSSKYVGGICGAAVNSHSTSSGIYDSSSTFSNCVNDGAVTMNDSTNIYSSIGGIVALSRQNVYVVDCVNNGDISCSADTASGIIGTVWYNADSVLAVIADCVNTGSATNDIYYYPTNSKFVSTTNVLRAFVYGCIGADGQPAEEDLPVYDPTASATYEKYKCIIPIASADDFAKIGNTTENELYVVDGFYMLDGGEEKEISFAEKTDITAYVVNKFSGVLYGNGTAITDLEMTHNSHMGFFRFLSGENCSAILKVDFGKAGNEVKVTQTVQNKNTGVIAAEIGVASTGNTYDTFVSDVDIHMDINVPNGYSATGAIAGKTMMNRFAIHDSNVYGRIYSTDNTTLNNDGNIGILVGNITANNTYYGHFRTSVIGCRSYCDVNISSASNKIIRVGFIGYNLSYCMPIVDCASFGDVTLNENASGNISPFVTEHNHGHGVIAVVASENYGTFHAKGSRGTAIAEIANTLSFMANSVVDYGGNGIEAIGANPNGKTTSEVNCSSTAAIAMDSGASIRIDPDVEDAGLRFTAQVSLDALAALEKEFGDGATVSYGMLITPTAFANKAGDVTAEALDAWAESDEMKDRFGTDKAYVDVVATPESWYKGQEGEFAASLNGIQSMLTTAFSGRAYIKVEVDGATVYTLYAAYSETDNSRVFTDILSAALNDVLYTNDNGTTWYVDEACATAADLTKVDPSEYTTNLSGDAAVKKYSCYTAAQYADLTALSGNITQ